MQVDPQELQEMIKTAVAEAVPRAVAEVVPPAVDAAVTKTVNGKIIALTDKVNEHMRVVEPYLKASSGLSFLGKFIMWVGGLAAAAISVKTLLTGKL